MVTMDEYIEQLLAEMPDNQSTLHDVVKNILDEPVSDSVKARLLKPLQPGKYRPSPPPRVAKQRAKERKRKALEEEFDPILAQVPHKSLRSAVVGWHPWLLLWQERSQDRRAGLQTDSMGARKFLERLADGCAQRASTGCWPQGFPWGCRTPNPEEARGGAQSPQRRTEIPAGSQGGSREGQSRWQWGIHRSCSTPQTGGRPPEKWDQSSPPPSIPKGAGNPWKVDPKRIWLGCRSGSHPLARHRQISASPGWILHPTTSGSEKQEGSGEC